MSLSMNERLKRRKLDALKRGVHRISSGEALPLATHVIGIGKAGIDAVTQIIRNLEAGAPKLTALAIDIGDQDMSELRATITEIPADRAEVTIVALDVPKPDDLFDALAHYGTFLRLEYPGYRWFEGQQSWLPRTTTVPNAGEHFSRAVAKAIYGYAYYSGQRELEKALRSFAARIDADKSQALVAVVFAMGGGTGGGIAVDLARHLSNGFFGRRVLVAGIGIAPCDGDLQTHKGVHLFSLLSELDVLGDETKNQGVVMSCGDMFRNPFTAGFIMIPQEHIWEATQDLAATNHRVDQEIASLVTAQQGTNIWELLRLLNWVAAPSTQHSAARTPWGPRWIHMLAFTDAAEPDLRQKLDLLPTYTPEYIEMRVREVDANAISLADSLQSVFKPEVPPQIVAGGRQGSTQFVLPSIAKSDLGLFYRSLASYNLGDESQRLLGHSLLLDQGILLCEASTQLEGMAGASLAGGNSWIAVPFTDIRGASKDYDSSEPETVGNRDHAA